MLGSVLVFSNYELCTSIARLFGCPRHFYSTTTRRWPAVYLHNSRTRAELFLVGTDHVSSESAKFVHDVIKDVKPCVVAVELCEQRAKALLSGSWHSKKLRWWELFAIKGGLRQKIITYIIKNMYAELAGMGFKPGQDLRAAIEEGKAIGAEVSYIDQDLDVTLERVAQDLNLRQAWTCYWEARGVVDQGSHGDDWWQRPRFLQESQEFCETLGLAQAILHERNEYMIRNLRKMKGTIVSVVGALHVQGMRELWEKADMECRQEKFPTF